MRVRLARGDLSFEAPAHRTVLDAALDAALNLPHSCKAGSCGACRARLLEGEVDYPGGPPLGLSESEAREGYILMCKALPRTDLCIETFEIAAPEDIVTKRLPARIERLTPLSHDVMGVLLRLPAAEEFRFQAGQYIDVMLPGGRRRSFSIASPPDESPPLELHVRRVAGGEFSERLFHEGTRGALLTIEGPLGQFVYRAADAARPMILLGGGTGLAPIFSIIRHVLHRKFERSMRLFWGVRAERDLYAHDALARLAAASGQPGPRLDYVPVLSEASPAWRGARGLVHGAALEMLGSARDADIYAAGPPAMIAAVRAGFAAAGADESRIFFDSFDYAPDARPPAADARQSSSADTND